jgi:hypothetical protein
MNPFTSLEPVVQSSEAIVSQVSPVLFGGAVFLLVLSCHALFAEASSLIHHRLTIPAKNGPWPWLARPFYYLSILLLLVSHLVEIGIWGYALYWAGLAKNLSQALYFSGSTYTTLGYGTDILPDSLNAITAVIALSGMFSIAWTTSALMGTIGLFHRGNSASSSKKPPLA